MRICVVGAGVVGLTSAYALMRDGHDVTVVDRQPAPGLETSFANGGQLSYCYVAPFASPSVLKYLPAWLLDPDAPTRFRPRLDARQWAWIVGFLRACTNRQSSYTTEHLVNLAFLSRDELHQSMARDKLDFGFVHNGKLVIYSNPASFKAAKAQMAFQARLGCEQQQLSPEACLAAEPALAAVRARILGGILTPSEELGDAFAFCGELARVLAAGGIRFAYGQSTRGFLTQGDRVTALQTESDEIDADTFVLCAGNGSADLARTVRMELPIYPVCGFSLSAPVTDTAALPLLSLTDYDQKVVYARLGKVFRAAAFADIVGYDTRLDQRRLRLLSKLARQTFPSGADFANATPWCGLRPATPTGLPIISPTPLPNLFVNSGHGALGFTLSMGAAALTADLVAQRRPAIAAEAFALA